jgi:hypothetical protein
MNENNVIDAFHKTETQKDLIMIASPIYHRKSFREKAEPTLLKYVSQRSLAVLLFIALALLANVGNKSSDKRDPGLSSSLAVSQSRYQETYLSLNPRRLVDKVFASIKDAFNDPALIEYANEQSTDVQDLLTAPVLTGSNQQSVRPDPLCKQPQKSFASPY